jgi:ribose/xylose/arabinose/galactoside ABC-type transport system permease subunit
MPAANLGLARRLKQHSTLVLLGVFGVFGCVFVPDFARPANLANILVQSSALGVLAVGQTFVILCGLIDLSVGQLIGLVVVLSSDYMAGHSARTLPALLLALLLGAGVGAVNGTMANRLRVHPLILTFGMLSVLQGVIFVYTDQSIGLVSPEIRWLANGALAGIPVAAVLLVVIAALAHLVLKRTRFGRHVFAVGGNEESARRAGVATDRVRLVVFIISGISAGLAGLLVAGRLGTGYPNAGTGFELDGIVAVVLGGTSLAGGAGGIAGSVAAAVLLGAISNILNLLEISAFVQILLKGVIVVGAILLTEPLRFRR